MMGMSTSCKPSPHPVPHKIYRYQPSLQDVPSLQGPQPKRIPAPTRNECALSFMGVQYSTVQYVIRAAPANRMIALRVHSQNLSPHTLSSIASARQQIWDLERTLDYEGSLDLRLREPLVAQKGPASTPRPHTNLGFNYPLHAPIQANTGQYRPNQPHRRDCCPH